MQRHLQYLLPFLFIPLQSLAMENIQFTFDALAPLHAPTSDSHFQYSYDAVGNQKTRSGSDGVTIYHYTPFNKLKKVEKAGVTLGEYVYGVGGRRIARINSDGTIDRYFGEVEKQGSEITSYFFLSGSRVAKRKGGGSLEFFHQDYLGSTSIITNSTGEPLVQREHYEYGALKAEFNLSDERYDFGDKRLDQATRLHYFEARSLNTAAGRFMQADTIVPNAFDPQSYNRYAYVNNNPLKYVDPTGHIGEEALNESRYLVNGLVDPGGFNQVAVETFERNLWMLPEEIQDAYRDFRNVGGSFYIGGNGGGWAKYTPDSGYGRPTISLDPVSMKRDFGVIREGDIIHSISHELVHHREGIWAEVAAYQVNDALEGNGWYRSTELTGASRHFRGYWAGEAAQASREHAAKILRGSTAALDGSTLNLLKSARNAAESFKGIAPFIGDAANVIFGLKSLAEGNIGDASIDFGSLNPLFDIGATIGAVGVFVWEAGPFAADRYWQSTVLDDHVGQTMWRGISQFRDDTSELGEALFGVCGMGSCSMEEAGFNPM